MELARLASKKQAATSPSGPLSGSRATGLPKTEKKVTTLSGSLFLASGGPTKKKVFAKKVAENYPG